VVLFLRPRGYLYQGRTVEAWFQDCANDQWVEDYPRTGEIGPSGEVFRLMGTNTALFLASRITRDLTPSRLELWTSMLPARFQPTSRHHEAYTAALLLSVCVKPPESMLNELLRPALNSTNDEQQLFARMACDSCRAVPPPPFTATGNYVTAVVTVLRPVGSRTVQTTNHGQIKMIEDWLQEVKSTQLPLEQLGAVGPWCTVTFYRGSNAISTNLIFASDSRTTRRELLTDDQRQKLLNIIGQK
jgi:hypothetical protein